MQQDWVQTPKRWYYSKSKRANPRGRRQQAICCNYQRNGDMIGDVMVSVIANGPTTQINYRGGVHHLSNPLHTHYSVVIDCPNENPPARGYAVMCPPSLDGSGSIYVMHGGQEPCGRGIITPTQHKPLERSRPIRYDWHHRSLHWLTICAGHALSWQGSRSG